MSVCVGYAAVQAHAHGTARQLVVVLMVIFDVVFLVFWTVHMGVTYSALHLGAMGMIVPFVFWNINVLVVVGEGRAAK